MGVVEYKAVWILLSSPDFKTILKRVLWNTFIQGVFAISYQYPNSENVSCALFLVPNEWFPRHEYMKRKYRWTQSEIITDENRLKQIQKKKDMIFLETDLEVSFEVFNSQGGNNALLLHDLSG